MHSIMIFSQFAPIFNKTPTNFAQRRKHFSSKGHMFFFYTTQRPLSLQSIY